MANSIYGNFEFAPKGFTRGEDVGKGQIGIPHIDPPLFLELHLIKTHSHSGVDSIRLASIATPEMVKGYKISEREERIVAAWSGAAATNGSVVLTFASPFLETPNVFVTPESSNGNIAVGVSAPTTTGVTIYWKDVLGGTYTTMNLHILVKGR